MRRILSWLLWPALVLGGVAWLDVALGQDLEAPIALMVLQVTMMALVASLERWMPEYASWNTSRHDVRTDALYLLVSGLLLTALLRTAIFAWTPSLGIWPADWPLAAQVMLAVAVTDFGSYVTHVVAHKKLWLWPIHAPHHSAQRLYFLNATRMHPLDQITTMFFSLLPVALLGMPQTALAMFDACVVVHLMIQHSNIRLRHGLLNHVFATAEFHRWHHSKVREESERNYASFLSLWDHLFRTFEMPNRPAPESVGLYDGATIGDAFADQLLHPFRAWRARR